MPLKTNYKDYQFQEGQTLRRYQQINNGDGTISLKDVTVYQQDGDLFGASDINDTNAEVNKIVGVQEITLRSGPVWSHGDPYTQNVSVSGITENDSPILDVKLSGTSEQMASQQEEWGKILKAETYDGGIKFYASEETSIALTILVKGK